MPSRNRLLSPQTLVTPALLSGLAIAVWRLWGPLRQDLGLLEHGALDRFGTSVPVLLTTGALALLSTAVLQAVLAQRLGGSAPRLLRQLVALVVWSVAMGAVAASVFEVPLGSLVTTSGMLVAVVGFALKNMISDVFAGVALPVKIGDWLEIDGAVGRVVEIGWRVTRMITNDKIMVVIPNTHLMAKPFRNLSQPSPVYRENFRITLPPSVTPLQAERNLLAAANQVAESMALGFPPAVRINGFNERGVIWELRYYVPDAGRASAVRYQVQRNLLNNLVHSGIDLPPAMVEVRYAAEPLAMRPGGEDIAFLRGVDVFANLIEEELDQIAAGMSRRLWHRGEAVVRQNDAGDSLFVLKEGLLAVSITDASGQETTVGQIPPGQCFGELSLLTGAPRSATVAPVVDSLIFEITRDSLAPLMQSRPELAVQLSQMLAERQLRNAPKLDAQRSDNGDDHKVSLAGQFLTRISSFFRLTVG
jgi:small-conductance mechanosensitive channel/CRP-like cAMP-binding protein